MEHYSAMKRNVLLTDATNLKDSMWLKEASLKRLHAVWLDLYDILKKTRQIKILKWQRAVIIRD